MKKKIIVLFLVCIIILLSFDTNSQAYTYKSEPYLDLKDKYKENIINQGDILTYVYDYHFSYQNERLEFTLYKENVSDALWTKTFDMTNEGEYYDYPSYTYTFSFCTDNLNPGKYRLHSKIYYYESGIWTEAKFRVSSTARFTINGFDEDDPANPIYITTYGGQDYSNTKRDVYSSIYSDEWVRGKWFDSNGKLLKNSSMTWHRDSTGWWYTNEKNIYFTDHWNKIDGMWYYFKPDGYMASNEWYNGYWFNSTGSWTYTAKLSWHRDSHGWWVEDSSGWYPVNKWQKIDGYWYYFNSSGYMTVNQYVDGYWLGKDGTYY